MSEFQVVRVGDEKIRFPAEMSDDEIRSALTKEYGTPQDNRDKKVYSTPLQSVRQGLQGMTFGFSDELGAAIAATAGSFSTGESWGDAYDNIHQSLQDKRESYSADNPAASTMLEIAGAFATGGLGAGKALSTQAFRNSSGMVKLAKIMGVGAAEGTVYGTGAADQGERVEGGAIGGALGGVAAPIGAGAINSMGRVLGAFTNYVSDKATKTAKSQAIDVLRDTADAVGLSPDQITDIMKKLGPEAALADLDDGFRVVARAGMNRQGTMREQGKDFVFERQKGQQERLLKAIESVSGSSESYKSTLAGIVSKRAKLASPLFEAAYKKGVVMTPEIERVVKDPMFEKAWEAGQTMAKSGKRQGTLEGDGVLLQLHATKMVIDDMIDAAMTQVGKTDKGRNHAALLVAAKNNLKEAIGEQNPEYIEALNVFAGESMMKSALKLGKDVMKKDPEEIKDLIAGMSEGEKELFRLGGVKGVNIFLDGVGEAHNAGARLMGKPVNQKRLALVMGDNAGPFLKRVGIEEEFTQTRQMLTGNSTTELQQQASKTLDKQISPGVVQAIMSNNPASLVSSIAETLSKSQATPEMIDQLGRMMFAGGMTKREITKIFSTSRVRQAMGDQYDELIGGFVRGGSAPALAPVLEK